MNAALPLPSSASAPHPISSTRRWLPSPTRRRRILALAALFGLVCLFFGAVAVTGRRDSPLGVFSCVVFLTIRLLGAGVGLRKLRQAGFDPRLPAHWMLLAFSLSLLLGALGTITWLSYNVRGVPVPYPSLADIGFGGHTLLWAAGLFLLYVVLQTTFREEVGPFLSLLTATWSLTVVLISLALGSAWAAAALPRLALSIYYPFLWALNCALAGSLVLGPKFRQMTGGWRAFVAVVYAGALVLFLTNIAYAVSSAVPAEGTAAKYLYHNGGLLDFLFATGNYLLMLGIVLLPLGRPLYHTQQADPIQPAGQAATRTSPARTSEGRRVPDRPRTRRKRVAAGRITTGAVPTSSAARTVQARTMDDGGASEEMRAMLKALSTEIQVLRRELTGRGDGPLARRQPRRSRSRAMGAGRAARPGKPAGWQGQRQQPGDFVPLAVYPGVQDGETVPAAWRVDAGTRGGNDVIAVAAAGGIDAQPQQRATGASRAGSPGDRLPPSAAQVGLPHDPASR